MSKEDNIVEQIKDKADIVETIGRLVQLRRSGKSWSGLCPFHKETDGSFHVYEDSSSFICFGCGQKGDIITFYEKYYNLSFLDACEKLAKEYGIDWQPGGSFSADKSKELLFEANRFAGSVYYEAMKIEGNPALTYMQNRGIDRKTISRFRIGYADRSGRMLAEKFEKNEELLKAAEEVGLIYKYSGRYRDRFEGRVMFPIVNTRGKVIGFGGRDIDGNAKAKYINSAGSKVYTKGANLYGLNVSHSEIHKYGYVVLVEGYMDLVALYKHGVTNVCAQLGTAFTPQQAKLLSRYTKNVVLTLDSDESGQVAAMKAIDILADNAVYVFNDFDMKVRVLLLAGAKDPDDFVSTYGREEWDKAVQNALPMYDFKIDRIRKGYDLTASDGLADFIKEVAKLISNMTPVEQDYYIRKLSEETGISKSAIEMQAQSGEKVASAKNTAGDSGNTVAIDRSESAKKEYDDLLCGIIRLSLGSESALEKTIAFRHMFEGTDYSGVMNAMLAYKELNKVAPSYSDLSETLEESDSTLLDFALKKKRSSENSDNLEQIDEYLIKLELTALRTKEAQLKESPDLNSDDIEASALKELMELQKRIKTLESEFRNMK